MATHDQAYVWIFNGEGAQFPSGVFSSKEMAEEWISKNALSGVLTSYPLDEGVLDWATRTGHFKQKTDRHRSADFIQRFSSAAQEHDHYENGRRGDEDGHEIGHPVGE